MRGPNKGGFTVPSWLLQVMHLTDILSLLDLYMCLFKGRVEKMIYTFNML